MRRLLHRILATVAVALFAVALFTGAALATEGEDDHAEETVAAEGFGSGQWDGLIVGAITGIAVGALVFASSDPQGIGGDHAGHH